MLARITDRKLRISLLFCAAILISVSAIAQTQISLNKDLPQMMVRVCPTLEDAQQVRSIDLQILLNQGHPVQAQLSEEWRKVTPKKIKPPCE